MNLINITFILSLILLFQITKASNDAAQIQLKIGDKVPSLVFSSVITPKGKRQNEIPSQMLKNKVIVLDFWATWCQGCILAIPHWGSLNDAMKNKPIVFIAVTIQDTAKVDSFLLKKPIKGWIGFDKDKALNWSYQIHGKPQAVIIDRDGKLLGYTHPQNLTPGLLDSVINQIPVKITNPLDSALKMIPQNQPTSVTINKTIRVPKISTEKSFSLLMKDFIDYDAVENGNDSMRFNFAHSDDSLIISANGFDKFPNRRKINPIDSMNVNNPPSDNDRIRLILSWNISEDTTYNYSHYFNNFGVAVKNIRGQYIQGSRKKSDYPFKFILNENYWSYSTSIPLKGKKSVGLNLSRKYNGGQEFWWNYPPTALTILEMD